MTDPGQTQATPGRGRAIVSLVGVVAVAAAVVGIVVVLRGTSPTSKVARDYVRAYLAGDFATACDLMDAKYRVKALAFVEAKNCRSWARDTRGNLNKAYTASFGGSYDRLNGDTTWQVDVAGSANHDSTVTVRLDVHGSYDRGDNARYRAVAGSKSQTVTVTMVQEKGAWKVASDTL